MWYVRRISSEETVLTDENFHQTIDLFKKFRETKREENNQTEAEKAQWEIHFLSFFFKEGKIGPQWQQTDENGQVFVYPHLDLFDESAYEYLTMRLDATTLCLHSIIKIVRKSVPIRIGIYRSSGYFRTMEALP